MEAMVSRGASTAALARVGARGKTKNGRVSARAHASAAARESSRVAPAPTRARAPRLDPSRARRSPRGGVRARAAGDDDAESGASATTESGDAIDDDDATVAGTVRRKRAEAAAKAAKRDPSLADINPLDLGRKSRKFVDGIFKSITGLTQITRPAGVDASGSLDDDYYGDLLSGSSLTEYENPNARYTTVLVVGAAGRVGRVLVRKLLLRGYTVKAVVRKPEDADELPSVVDVLVGDVSDASMMERAIQGVNKVVYCARAKSTMSGDLNNVESEGVRVAAKALQDYNNALAIRRAGRSSKTKAMLTNFVKHKSVFEDWTVDETRLVDPGDGRWQAAAEVAQRVNFGPGGDVEEPSKFPSFDGFVFSKTGVAQISAAIEDLGTGASRGNVSLRQHDGVLLRLRGDGKRYSVSLREPGSEGRTFIAPFATTGKWQIVRLPFSQFRPEVFNRALNSGEADLGAPMDLNNIERVGIRFEARNQATSRASGGWMNELNTQSENSFGVELEYVKLLPKGEETDFILVSCGGAHVEDEEEREKVVAAKRLGERTIRNSGLGYTIVRPGMLLEEPGGSQALVFDQGNRITMPISCADVADVCVKALHDEEARNKSFDVCYEYGSGEAGGESQYEKIAQVSDKSNNYLTPALAVLEKNT